MRRLFIALIVIVLMAACEPEPPTATPRPTIANAVAPSPVIDPVLPTLPGYTPHAQSEFTPGFNYTLPAPVATAPSLALSIPLEDVILSARFYRGNSQKPGTVILLHGENQSSNVWLDVPAKLQSAGLNVITLDLRGYGRSSGQLDWTRNEADLHNALTYLASLNMFDANRIAFIGLEAGAALAVSGCVGESACRAVVVISPKNIAKLDLSKSIPLLSKRPLLLIGAQTEALKPLRDLVTGEGTLQQFEGARGADLIQNNADASGVIAAWLLSRI